MYSPAHIHISPDQLEWMSHIVIIIHNPGRDWHSLCTKLLMLRKNKLPEERRAYALNVLDPIIKLLWQMTGLAGKYPWQPDLQNLLVKETYEIYDVSSSSKLRHRLLNTRWKLLQITPPQKSLTVTIVRDDGPGHGSSIDASKHPEHAEPAQVLATLLLSQKLRIIREHDRNRTSNSAEKNNTK